MSEQTILSRLERKVRRLGLRLPGLVRGIGDDCAVYRPRGSAEDLLFTTDLLIEDVHFRAGDPARSIGHRVLARGLSDIAAMGGDPRFCLLSLALPRWADDAWLERFQRGFLRLARRAGAVLAGGDLARAERLTCDIVVCGAVPRGKALMRSGARPGDAIYVSGRLGGAALGLAMRSGAPWRLHLRPEPRLALGRFLRQSLCATAAMDLSDGLSLDLHRLCLASGVSASLQGELPRYPGATEEQALHGGEDYELLFTVRAGTRVPRRFERILLTRIGTITCRNPGRVIYQGRQLQVGGYDHFRAT